MSGTAAANNHQMNPESQLDMRKGTHKSFGHGRKGAFVGPQRHLFIYKKQKALIIVAVKEFFVAILQMSHFSHLNCPLVDSRVLLAGMDYNTFQNYRHPKYYNLDFHVFNRKES
jgi:hypothetical protein